MSFTRLALLTAALAVTSSAAELTGTWKAVFTGPVEHGPKMVAEIVLNLTAHDNSLTGTVRAGNWPGFAPIADGRIEGDRVFFTMTGTGPWKSGNPNGEQASGYPKLMFTGTLEGREMKIHLVWSSVMICGRAAGNTEYEMRARRIDD